MGREEAFSAVRRRNASRGSILTYFLRPQGLKIGPANMSRYNDHRQESGNNNIT